MEAERDDTSGACPAAHERAVMTVRVTLLLLLIGVALFLFTDPGGAFHSGQGFGDHAGRHK